MTATATAAATPTVTAIDPPHLNPVAIVAHINRAAMAEQLAAATAARHISYDDGALGCEGNHRQAWQHHVDNPAADWAVVLEDDARPVSGFLSQLDRALEVAPTPIVSLYLGTSRPLGGWQPRIHQTILAIKHTSACWITCTHLLHAVGVAIRTPLLASMLEWLPQIPLPIDEAITVWAHHYGHQIGYTWPSLVDHHDGPTLVNHADRKPRDQPRIAWNAGTRHEWNSQQITMKSPYDRSR